MHGLLSGEYVARSLDELVDVEHTLPHSYPKWADSVSTATSGSRAFWLLHILTLHIFRHFLFSHNGGYLMASNCDFNLQ